ncbi:MAG: PEP-CTERM sorting domain-containing protein [bacterium]|nr:PEP-CTERM sorting domain-containing protein [bacterium]
MKTMRSFLVLFVSLAFAAGLSAQTLTGFGVIKTNGVTQTVNGTSTLSGTAISAYVFGSSSSLSGTYTFTPPAGGTVTTPQTLTGNSSSVNFDAGYADVTTLNNAYANGIYSMALPNSLTPTSWSFTQPLMGNAYPNAPLVTGTWSGGLLQVDPTQNYTLTFAPFGGFLVNGTHGDSISLSIEDSGFSQVHSDFSNVSVNTFLITAGTLTAGQTYNVSLRFNNNYIDYGAIGSANGSVSYTTENSFQIQAIPEPSTYAAILGVVALGGVMIRRRRLLRAS